MATLPFFAHMGMIFVPLGKDQINFELWILLDSKKKIANKILKYYSIIYSFVIIGNKAKYEGDPLHAHGGSAWVN